MNGLKIRKLAAIVAGGALLGAAMAPMVSAITSAEAKSVTYNAEMSPNVNIVVGSSAAVSDGVWAGNIARKVVEKAVMEKVYTGGAAGSGTAVVTDLSALLSLGGTVTVTGGKTFNTSNLVSNGNGQEYEQSIGKDPLSFLNEKTVSYKYNDSSTSIDTKETIGVGLDSKFSTSSTVKDLMAQVDAGDINYILNLGGGIPTVATANVGGSTADFTDGSDDNIRISFFGKTFLVQKVDIDDSNAVVELRLIEDKAKQSFVAGESFTMPGIGAYAGQTLTITIVSVVATGPAASAYQAKFNLTDEAGNVIDTQTTSAGNFVTFEDSSGDDVVSGDVYLDGASVNTGTNEGTVDVLVGTSSVRLRDGENYPYIEAADSENVNGPYVVSIGEVASSNRLTSVIIKNRSKSNIGTPSTAAETTISAWPRSTFDNTNPFYSKNDSLTSAGQSGTSAIKFLDGTGALGEGLFTVTFNGFKAGEDKTYVQIGDNEVNFRDSADTSHSIPFWFFAGSETGNDATTVNTTYGTTAQNNANGVRFQDGFDNGNKTLYYDVNTMTQDFNVSNGTILNGVAVGLQNIGGIMYISSDLNGGITDVNSQTSTSVVIGGVQYAVPYRSGPTSVTLRADGWARFAKATINSSTASADFLDGPGGASNVTVAPAGGSGGASTASMAHVFFYEDANISSAATAGIAPGPNLTLSGDTYFANYGFFVNESGTTINSRSSNKGMYLTLNGNTNAANTTGTGKAIPTAGGLQKSKQLTFFGTDTGENMGLDTNFYIPQRDEFGQTPSSETVDIAWFGLDENNTSGYTLRTYIDTREDKIPVLGGTGNKISAPGSDVNYGLNIPGINGINLQLSTDSSSSSSLTAAYTDWGTKFSITDGKTAEFWIPQNRETIEFVVTGASSTTTVEDGEEMTVAEGDTGTFTTGTTVTVKDITYTATVTDGSTVVTSGSGFTYTTPAALNGKAQVYTDAQSVAGPKIVVGGPAVNALATEVADVLNASGDKVAGVYGSNIIVAGYTAADTGTAAQELISALDAI